MTDMTEHGFSKSHIMHNFFFSSLSTFLNIAIPLLTYPYIARVLGPVNIGKLGIASSFTNYFIVAASIGLPVYGVREIARTRDDASKLRSTASELLFVSIISAVLSSLLFLIVIALVPQYKNDFLLFLIFGTTIAGSTLGIEWFFQGIERFRYIGVRNVIIKAVFVLSIFIFIRKENDYRTYALLFAISNVAGAIINLCAASRHVHFSFTHIQPIRHVTPMAIFALYSFLITAYTNLDLLFLGLFSQNEQAGLYNISIRIVRMIIAFIATFSTVLMPRLSFSREKDARRVGDILKWSSDLILMTTLPAGAGLIAVSGDLALVFAGSSFVGAVSSLKILAGIVPLVALSNFLQMQVLIPLQKERKMILSFIAGLFVSAIILALLVPPYGQVGAAWGMLAGEFTVLIGHSIICGRSELKKIFRFKSLVQYLAGSVLCAGAALVPYLWLQSGLARLIVSTVLGVFVYCIYLLALRNEHILAILHHMKQNRA